MEKNINVFVIIVIYNGLRNDWIKKCLDSLKLSSISIKIVAVDNNSKDNSVAYIKKYYPNVILLENTDNRGFGGANNQGLKYALKHGGEYFILLNQDAYVKQNTIEELVKQSVKNHDFGIISPIHLNGDGTALDYNFSEYISPSSCKMLYSDFVINKVKDKIYLSNFICAACWLLSRKTLEIVGGFNPVFFHYAEDDNYIHRLHFKSLKIGVYPKAIIFHDRENRDNSEYFNNIISFKRSLLLKFSNPNIKVSLFSEFIVLFKYALKFVIKLDKRYLFYLLEYIKFLILLRKKVFKHMKVSRSDRKFVFISD